MHTEPAAKGLIWVLAIIAALLFVVMAVYTWPLKPSILRIQLTFSEAAFNLILGHWKSESVHLFKTHFVMDFPFLVCYGALGHLVAKQTNLFARYTPRATSILALTLPCVATADATENVLHLFFLSGAGPFSRALYLAAGLAASIKWLFVVVFIANSAYAGYNLLHRRFRSCRSNGALT